MILTATKISKSFGEAPNQTYALREVSFAVDFGEMLYIVGPSGSGKTTLLSIISGILRPDDGDVVVKDTDIWKLGSDALAGFRLQTIGFVFQDYHLFPRLTTLENVAIPLILRREPWEKSLAEARKTLQIVGLAEKESLPPYKLSGGEQQRVAIARAIVAQPDLLIFDEPTASLDGETGRKIVAFVKEHILNERRAIIIVTHDSRIYEYATRIIRMEDGRIVPGAGADHEK
ncbi:ABC transporter ATP-binding protein [Acidithiobacillus sulfuriphilus]|uniref:ABC transporter ATP-binding protein n=2 Tax=Acidithiobacillus sulfuriphilus TaxID=1867749 RepID=A0A3M8QYG3_9PROT|nr:ABC transporter ATP-binding protein [Acidithiobacillus sulfuriphilus]RNF59510.1 ABC transporter ATP-binding protein [Acidithiobacillus sulfuriphilus]